MGYKDGRWYKASISACLGGGRYRLDWADGDSVDREKDAMQLVRATSKAVAMARFCVVTGSNGWSGQGPQGLLDAMHHFNGKKATIHEVAIGPDDQWAVVTSEGSKWSANRNQGFGD